MNYQTTHQEPFTQYPNRYTDRIKPKLTDTQRDICDVVIRYTDGYHKTTAEISLSTFIKKTGKTKQGIIKAKKQLKELGLLIELKKGGGANTGVYMLDIYYDIPGRSIGPFPPEQEEQPKEIKNTMPEQEVFNFELDSSILEPDVITEDICPEEMPENCQTSIEQLQEESHIIEEPISEIATSDEEKSGKTDAENSNDMDISGNIGGKQNLPPSIVSTNKDLNLKEKQTKEQNKKERKNPKKAVASVRFKFLSIFPETKAEDDWRFFGWAIKEYGLETCMDKLNYMKEHRKKHRIANPKGFFRFSLEKDYQVPKFISEKIKADKRAELSCQKTKDMIAEMEATKANINYEAGAMALQNIIDMLN